MRIQGTTNVHVTSAEQVAPRAWTWVDHAYADVLVFGSGEFHIQFQRLCEMDALAKALTDRAAYIRERCTAGSPPHKPEFYKELGERG
jgi:hypothetical protein